MARFTVVIVGAGQGGLQVAASLREGGFDGAIVLVGDEPGLPYQRPPLSKGYLTGEVGADRLLLRREAFYVDRRIDLLAGERAVAIDRPGRRVRLASGGALAYDHLVLATGARDRPLPVPGAELDGVLRLRTRAEAELLRQRLAGGVRDAVVVGAGFIGLEFASVAAKLGARVHVIEMTRRPMARAVSPDVSAFFHAAHAGAGAGILFGATVARLVGADGRVAGVETGDGLRIPADLVVVGIGVVPNTELAAGAGLAVDDGIVVDEHLLTADPAISAVGDCAAYPSRFAAGRVRLESVQNAVDQARCVAARLAGRPPAPYAAVPWFWSDQGKLRLQIVGLTAGHDVAVVRGDVEGGAFSVFCFRGRRLVGIESVNRPADHMAGRRLLAGGWPDLAPEQLADAGFDLQAQAAAVRPAAGGRVDGPPRAAT